MKSQWIRSFTAVCLLGAASIAGAQDASIFAVDKQFVHDYGAIIAEIQQIAQLEQDHGQDTAVKNLAQQLAQDYNPVSQQIAAVARAAGLAQPQLSEEANRKIKKLEGLAGEDFDRTALRNLFECEQAATHQLELELANGSDLTIKQMTWIFQGTLQPDLDATTQLETQLNGNVSISKNAPSNTLRRRNAAGHRQYQYYV